MKHANVHTESNTFKIACHHQWKRKKIQKKQGHPSAAASTMSIPVFPALDLILKTSENIKDILALNKIDGDWCSSHKQQKTI